MRSPACQLSRSPGAEIIEALTARAARGLRCRGNPNDEVSPLSLRQQLQRTAIAEPWHVDEQHGRTSFQFELVFSRARGGRQRPHSAPRARLNTSSNWKD